MHVSEERQTSEKITRARIGERLRQNLEELIGRYQLRMRSDPAIPAARSLSVPVLEDHALSLLGDLFQSLVVLERQNQLTDEEESDLLGDGSEIQRLVSDLHGRQRHKFGWTESALEREYQILDEEVESLVRRYVPDVAGSEGIEWALDLLKRQLERSRDASFAGYAAAAASPRAEDQRNC
jgi:hypothetical protein